MIGGCESCRSENYLNIKLLLSNVEGLLALAGPAGQEVRRVLVSHPSNPGMAASVTKPPAMPLCRRWCSCTESAARRGRGADNWIFLEIASHAVAWDMPGDGGSAPLAKCSIAALADALQDFLQQVGATKPILVGHSIGGMVVQQLPGEEPPHRQRRSCSHKPARRSANPTATGRRRSSRRGSARSIAAKRLLHWRRRW